ncbi:hypothetical protein LOTGIDRAFT_158857 [Lottia gigantea]|uniref:Uncharacterized protein n=1 Tax=Lottia gigantea TaxID=225164 RepID=V4AVA0_LOTGI|nr:hypothetical protein LOTGIDRAFT_158857 [Lottia gigantea]ESO98900.1 hypothetical protein LOTGIDRAFT_158857 [Lottia gigantea]
MPKDGETSDVTENLSETHKRFVRKRATLRSLFTKEDRRVNAIIDSEEPDLKTLYVVKDKLVNAKHRLQEYDDKIQDLLIQMKDDQSSEYDFEECDIISDNHSLLLARIDDFLHALEKTSQLSSLAATKSAQHSSVKLPKIGWVLFFFSIPMFFVDGVLMLYYSILNRNHSLGNGTFVENIALNKPVNSSSMLKNKFAPCNAVDGRLTEMVHTQNSDIEWWCVDLEKIYNFQSVVLYNRDGDVAMKNRLAGFELRFSDNGHCNIETFNGSRICYKDTEAIGLLVYNITSCNQPGVSFSSRFIFLSPRSDKYLTFRQLMVFEPIG